MLDLRLKPLESLLFRSDLVAIGTFRCPAEHPLFRDTGPSSHHTFVFPRTSTAIRHEGREAFVAVPGMVTYYNQRQVYFREAVSAADHSDWSVVADDVLRDAVARHDPRAADDPAGPFRFRAGPADPRTLVEHRLLVDAIGARRPHDPLAVEERVVTILDRLLARAYSARGTAEQARRAVEGVEEAARRIARDPSRNDSLRDLARAAGLSPFHLCRLFARVRGTTLTSFRHGLRLSVALERLLGGASDLTALALDLGYSSHSHFTSAFRRHFGVPPSALRRRV